MSALSPWQWVVMALVPPAVLLLYFLKLKRQPIEVPSTFLWRRAVEDIHVNSLWQKLKTSLLLLLQMLFLGALILACMRPGFRKESEDGRRWIFLVDNSASMSATDNGVSRLEAAKKQIAERIDTMQRGDVAMLLAFSDRADVRQGFTEDKRRLQLALSSIQPTNRTTQLGEALRAAAGLANPGRASFDNVNDVKVADALPADLFIYSDGKFEPLTEFDLGNLKAEYIPIGTETTDNVGIIAFSVDRLDDDEGFEAFGRITNFSAEPVSVTASLYRDDKLLDAAMVELEPKGESGVSFTLQQLDPGGLELRLDHDDQLMLDNTAFAAIRPPSEKNVLLVSPGNVALETAFSTAAVLAIAKVDLQTPDFLQTEDYQKACSANGYDLIIYDQCSPEKLPPANTLFIASSPPGGGWELGDLTGPLFVLDIDRTHPMIQYLEMGSVRIVEGKTVKPPEGGSILMNADVGPIMAISPRDAFQDAVLGFAIVNSLGEEAEPNTDWGIKRSFPIFVFSVVRFLAGGITSAAASTVQPGQPASLTLQNSVEEFEIEVPGGKKITASRGAQSQLVFTQTELPGNYAVRSAGEDDLLELFSVNLFSEKESDVSTVQEMQLGEKTVKASTTVTPKRKEFWRWILVIGFGFLLLEWVVYNRRVFI